MFIALTGAILSAITLVIQKFILSTQKVNYKTFNAVVFSFLFIFSLLAFPKFGWIKPEAFSAYYLILVGLMIAVAAAWNILLTISLQKEQMVEFELIAMAQPLVTIVFGSLIFASERNWQILLLAIIASLALIISHLRKDHIYFDKYARYLLLAILLMSVEFLLIKILLAVYSPVALYMIRTFLIAIVFWIFVTPPLETVKLKNLASMGGVAALAVIQMVLIYTAIETKGLVYTTLFLILSPVLVYAFSILLFKERMKLRTAVCIIVILFCIAYTAVL